LNAADLAALVSRSEEVLISAGTRIQTQTPPVAQSDRDFAELADIVHDFLLLIRTGAEAQRDKLMASPGRVRWTACVLHSSPEWQLRLALGILKDAKPEQLAQFLTLDTIGFLESQLVLAGKIVARESAPPATTTEPPK
jgi:hypothetical protein